MKLPLLCLIMLPVIGFCQSTKKNTIGKWCGNYTTTSTTFPDGVKIKDTLIVHDTIKSVFIFYRNNTGKLLYSDDSKDFEKVPAFIFTYKISPGSIIKFFNKQTKTLSKFQINNDTLYFRPYPISKATQESIELFYDIKYVRTK